MTSVAEIRLQQSLYVLNSKKDQNFVVGQRDIWFTQFALATMGPQLQKNRKIEKSQTDG